MKNIKCFKLFESKGESKGEIDIDSICSLYEDIKSIEYILEERGIYPQMRLEVVCVPVGTTLKEVRLVRIRRVEDIREVLYRPTYVLRSLMIEIENNKGDVSIPKWDPRNKIIGDDSFKEEFGKYWSLLREHLDYVPDEFISHKLWRPPLRYEVSISSDFFRVIK